MHFPQFQFQDGTIKSQKRVDKLFPQRDFNSKMVRLKVSPNL